MLDLRGVSDPRDLDGRTIEVERGVGHLEVIVPGEMDVEVTADVNGPGDIQLFGNDVDGIDIRSERQYDGGQDVPTLMIDAELGVGQIEVHS